MTMAKTVEFHIEVPVTARDLKDLIEDAVADITGSFAYEDKQVQKDVAKLKKELFLDGKFRQLVEKALLKQVQEVFDNVIEYGVGEDLAQHPKIKKFLKNIEDTEEREYEKYRLERDKQNIQSAIQLLKSNGFRVTEAG
jgi:hypothetical protein